MTVWTIACGVFLGVVLLAVAYIAASLCVLALITFLEWLEKWLERKMAGR